MTRGALGLSSVGAERLALRDFGDDGPPFEPVDVASDGKSRIHTQHDDAACPRRR